MNIKDTFMSFGSFKVTNPLWDGHMVGEPTTEG
jgi:hypothetical protein